jgi:hypothetical protein
MFDIKGFEDRHPFVRSLLRGVTVDSIDHASAVALRFEDAAKQLAIALPDGQALQELLTTIQEVQTRAVNAVHDFAPTPAVNESSSPASATAGATPAPGLTLIPGRDHPITAPPPGTVTTAETDQAPAPEAPAEAPEPAADAPAEPVGDSGPLGVVHADTDQQAVS